MNQKSLIQGFTLLELLVVMAIMAMLAALIIPRISSGNVTVLQAQARQAVAVLNYAHRTAIVEGKTKTAVFYAGDSTQASHQITVSANQIQWASHGASLQMRKPTDQDTMKQTDQDSAQPNSGQPLNDQNEPSSATTYEITFYPEGGSSGGELTLSYQEYQVKITINPLTGKIVSEFVNDKK